jgi:hypothetical protein
MICDRFAFVIIYLALFGFKANHNHSWAANPNLLNTNVFHNQTTLPQDIINGPQKTNFIPQRGDRLIAKESSANLQPAEQSTESKEINRLWPFGGMALTSAIALFLTSVLFSKPQQKHELSTANENFKPKETSAESDAVSRNLIQDNIVAPLGLDIARNAWELEKSLVPGKVSLSNPSLVDIDADIDVVQELINDLQHPENYPHSNPESYPHKYSDLENLVSVTESAPPEISIRRKAIEKLARVGDHRSIEALLNVMPQVDAVEKSSILQAVTRINQRTFQFINNELFIALRHEDPEVRLNALRDLRNLYQFVSPVITEIAKMQSDQDYEIRTTAIETLRQLNANPLPTFDNYCDQEVDFDHEVNDLTMGIESDNNLHLVAYLLAELDAER